MYYERVNVKNVRILLQNDRLVADYWPRYLPNHQSQISIPRTSSCSAFTIDLLDIVAYRKPRE